MHLNSLQIILFILGGICLSIATGLFKDWLKKIMPKRIAVVGVILFFSGFIVTGVINYKKEKKNNAESITHRIPDIYNTYLEKGKIFYLNNEFDSALFYFNHAIQVSHRNDDAYFQAGLTYQKKRNYLASINNFTNAIQLNPSNDQAYYNRGGSYLKLKEYGNALNDYSQAINLKPKTEYYTNRGLAYHTIKNYDSSLSDYNIALNLDPKNANTYLFRGFAYLDKAKTPNEINEEVKKNIDFSIADCTKALLYNPDLPLGYLTRAMAQIENMRYLLLTQQTSKYIEQVQFSYDFAQMDITSYTNLKGDLSLAYFYKAYSLMFSFGNKKNDSLLKKTFIDKKIYDLAINNLDSSISSNKEFAHAYYLRSIIKRWNGMLPDALKDSTTARKLGYNSLDYGMTDISNQFIMLHPQKLELVGN